MPKYTIPPPVKANRPWTGRAPGHRKACKEGTEQPIAGTEQAPRRDTPTRNGGRRAVQDNVHINRKRAGKIYNPALEADPGPPPITTEAGSDLPGHTLTSCNHKLCLVYKYHIHSNDGTHLTGGIADNVLCQTWWRLISNPTPIFYKDSKGKASQHFVTLLTEELCGAQERRWNSKHPMVSIGTVLAQILGVKKSKDIRDRLLRRMNHWKDGPINTLVENTCGTVKARGECQGNQQARQRGMRLHGL